VLLCLLFLGAACGGGGDEEPAPGTPAATAAATPSATPAATDPAAQRAAQDSTRLQREIFSFRGPGRDPFRSLLTSASLRPLVQDVRVAGITFDAQYPARSVAILRDSSQQKRYAVRVGDEIGLLRITEIRTDAVVVTLDEFGAEKQVVLLLKRQEATKP
jgi:hypothetical protein